MQSFWWRFHISTYLASAINIYSVIDVVSYHFADFDYSKLWVIALTTIVWWAYVYKLMKVHKLL